jgi:hypothetical protein
MPQLGWQPLNVQVMPLWQGGPLLQPGTHMLPAQTFGGLHCMVVPPHEVTHISVP